MQESGLSLRERQRLEVSSAIHDAAASLLLEHGWTATTIDMIAVQAGISSRTFFNYFATKEDAALGLQPLHVPNAALDAFRESDKDLLDRAVMLTMAVLRTATPDDGLGKRRSALIQALPELQSRVKHFATTASELIEPILIDELTRSRPAGASTDQQDTQDTQDTQDAATALRMLAGTVIRFAFSKDPAALSATTTATLTAAITTFREAMRNPS